MAGDHGIRVKSRTPSFWRAGIQFSRDGVDLDASQLTDKQLDAIRSERNLIVTEIPPESESGRSGAGDPLGKDAGGTGAPQTPASTPAGKTTQRVASASGKRKAPASKAAR